VHAQPDRSDSLSLTESASHAALPTGSIWIVATLLIAGCDPVISIAGATLPIWMLCLFAGVMGSLVVRPLLVASGIDEWLKPRPIVYASLALIIAFVSWLLIGRPG
jgi:hypothetical protein